MVGKPKRNIQSKAQKYRFRNVLALDYVEKQELEYILPSTV